MCQHCEGNNIVVYNQNYERYFADYFQVEGGRIHFLSENEDGEATNCSVPISFCPWCGRKLAENAPRPQWNEVKPWGYMLTSSDHETVFGIVASMNKVNDLIMQKLDEWGDCEGEFQLFPLLDESMYLNVVLERKVTFK